MNTDVISHYDLLTDENNDPVNDPLHLRKYMDTWDGPPFLDALHLDSTKSVLEIGVGTGRLAVKTAPCCKPLKPKTHIFLLPKSGKHPHPSDSYFQTPSPRGGKRAGKNGVNPKIRNRHTKIAHNQKNRCMNTVICSQCSYSGFFFSLFCFSAAGNQSR